MSGLSYTQHDVSLSVNFWCEKGRACHTLVPQSLNIDPWFGSLFLGITHNIRIFLEWSRMGNKQNFGAYSKQGWSSCLLDTLSDQIMCSTDKMTNPVERTHRSFACFPFWTIPKESSCCEQCPEGEHQTTVDAQTVAN